MNGRKDAHLDDIALGRFNVIKTASTHILKNIGLVKYLGAGAFTICDYGTLDGMTSMAVVSDCIDVIKSIHGNDTEVTVLYEDLPCNDFNTLLRKINGSGNGHPSYMLKHNNVFVAAIGTGFYRQCVASGSIHFALSAGAMHFLEKRPCLLTGTMHHTLATDELQKRMFAEQAAADWEKVLLLRARELVPGGRMVITLLGRDKDGQSTGHTRYIKESMFAQLDDVWTQMLNENRITQSGYDELTFSEYFRDEEESISPLVDPTSPVYKAGLRLVSIESKVIRCVYHTKWMNEGKKGDSEAQWAHARRYIEKMRSWADLHILPCLGNNRSQADKEAILEQMFDKYAARVAAAPEDHGMDYVVLHLCVQKIG